MHDEATEFLLDAIDFLEERPRGLRGVLRIIAHQPSAPRTGHRLMCELV